MITEVSVMTNCREAASLSAPASSRRSRTKGLAYRIVKRFLDIVLSLSAIAVLAVPMLIIALIIRIDSPGAALFRQNRVGLGGKCFKIYKFRTMYCTAPSETETGDLDDAYRYITRSGVFLRKTSLDELPQLFNVLIGDMSLIGPRPLIMGNGEIHALRKAAKVYSVRPGITGWAQVNGRDNLTNEQKVALDAEYVKKISFIFDLSIIFRTVSVVLSGDGFAEGKQAVSDETKTETEENVVISDTHAA